jgi:hypothetical protein
VYKSLYCSSKVGSAYVETQYKRSPASRSREKIAGHPSESTDCGESVSRLSWAEVRRKISSGSAPFTIRSDGDDSIGLAQAASGVEGASTAGIVASGDGATTICPKPK